VSEDTLCVSLESGPHAILSSFLGSWAGTTRTWFRPSELGDELAILHFNIPPGVDEYLGVETRYRRVD